MIALTTGNPMNRLTEKRQAERKELAAVTEARRLLLEKAAQAGTIVYTFKGSR